MYAKTEKSHISTAKKKPAILRLNGLDNSRHVTIFKRMDNNFKFKTRDVSIAQRSSSVVNLFTSSVESTPAMGYKLKRDTIQNLKKLTYNFKKHETLNKTCASTTLDTRKKIVINNILLIQ